MQQLDQIIERCMDLRSPRILHSNDKALQP
jgi:hypothetical protein